MSSADQKRRLDVVYEEIHQRTQAITRDHPFWPCRRGCDECCRSLWAPPSVSRLEWERLWEGFEGLSTEQKTLIRERVSELKRDPPAEGRVTCPFLERERGSCLVYEHRPAICRAYGFYVDRVQGNWCNTITDEVVRREELVLWGNQGVLDRELSALSGPPISIFEWFAQAHK